jgi:CheY-like chemotaxis protein
VLRRLRDEAGTRAIPIIAVTASAMEESRKEILEAGFDGYLSKPIDIAAFLSVVRAKLDEQLSGETG